MSYARTIAAAATAAFVLVLVPVAASSAPATEQAVAAPAPIVALPSVEAIEKIDGVRVIADTAYRIEMAGVAIEKFAAAGWEIENTEIRWSEDECDGAVGFHAEERGHHVVVMCTDAAWTLLHELGHVWSDLYLDGEGRDEWLERRGLDSWHEGPYDERGTEQAAQVIAFGLHDTVHVPSMSNNSYSTLVDDFEWLFGTGGTRS